MLTLIFSNTVECCMFAPLACPSSDSFHVSLAVNWGLFWKLEGEGQVGLLLSPFQILTSLLNQVYLKNWVFSWCLLTLILPYSQHFTSDNSGHQMCGGFSYTKQFSTTPAGYPTIELNSGTVYLEIVSDTISVGLSPVWLIPAHFRCWSR